MDLRKPLLQTAKHLAVPVKRQLRVEAPNDVKLGDRFRPAPARCLPHLFKRHSVRLRIARLLTECAKAATCDTHVRRIDVAIHVIERDVSVQTLSNDVGHIADRQNVGRAVQSYPVLKAQPGTLLYFFEDGFYLWIVDDWLQLHSGLYASR